MSKNIANTHIPVHEQLLENTRRTRRVFEEVCIGPPQFYGCADNPGSVILVMVLCWSWLLQEVSSASNYKRETQLFFPV